jgi:hypothetical protein
VRARRVGGTQHGAGVSRIADVGQQRNEGGLVPLGCHGPLGDLGERDVDETADGEQALRGHRLGQFVHDLAADDVHRYARGGDRGDQVVVPGPGGHGHEQVGDRAPQ